MEDTEEPTPRMSASVSDESFQSVDEKIGAPRKRMIEKTAQREIFDFLGQMVPDSTPLSSVDAETERIYNWVQALWSREF